MGEKFELMNISSSSGFSEVIFSSYKEKNESSWDRARIDEMNESS
jgi:hypothetical protein